jgi:hypothetical protein
VVYYEGQLLPDADAATFRMREIPNEQAFAEDARATYVSATRTPRP